MLVLTLDSPPAISARSCQYWLDSIIRLAGTPVLYCPAPFLRRFVVGLFLRGFFLAPFLRLFVFATVMFFAIY